ncbi:hypothetical protein WJX79_004200 [Trebouxia sp. C0005]
MPLIDTNCLLLPRLLLVKWLSPCLRAANPDRVSFSILSRDPVDFRACLSNHAWVVKCKGTYVKRSASAIKDCSILWQMIRHFKHTMSKDLAA